MVIEHVDLAQIACIWRLLKRGRAGSLGALRRFAFVALVAGFDQGGAWGCGIGLHGLAFMTCRVFNITEDRHWQVLNRLFRIGVLMGTVPKLPHNLREREGKAVDIGAIEKQELKGSKLDKSQ